MARRPVVFACSLALVLAPAREARAEGPGLESMIERAAERAGLVRRVQAVGGIVGGTTLVLAGKVLYDNTPREDTSSRAAAATLLGAGAIAFGSGPFALFGDSPLERIAAEVREIPGLPNDPERLARADLLLELASRNERAARDSAAWVSSAFAAIFVGLAVHEGLSESASDTTRLVRASTYGAGAAGSVVNAILLAKTAGPVGELAEAWSAARAAGAPCVRTGSASASASGGAFRSVTLAPMGAGLALSGAF